MRTGVRVGQVAGVPVSLDGGTLGLVALLTVVLAVSVLPAASPQLPDLVYWTTGLGAAGLLVASLLAHEVAHAVTARRNGATVGGISLWAMGGTTDIRDEHVTPAAEARIAVVGPVASAAVGGLMAAAGLGLAALDLPLPGKVLWWLGTANLLLAAFNLLPGAPLDGGRVLAALLWWRSGDRLGGARRAARTGRHLATGMALLGGVQLVARGDGGPWLLLLAWFLWSASGAEEARVRTTIALTDARVADVMGRDLEPVEGWIAVATALERRGDRPRGSAWPVLDAGDHRTGVVSLARLRSVPADERARTTVAAVATPMHLVPTATPQEPLIDVVTRFRPGQEQLAVEDDGDLVGILDLEAVALATEALTGGAR